MNGVGSEGIIYWLHLNCTGGDAIYTAGSAQCPHAYSSTYPRRWAPSPQVPGSSHLIGFSMREGSENRNGQLDWKSRWIWTQNTGIQLLNTMTGLRINHLNPLSSFILLHSLSQAICTRPDTLPGTGDMVSALWILHSSVVRPTPHKSTNISSRLKHMLLKRWTRRWEWSWTWPLMKWPKLCSQKRKCLGWDLKDANEWTKWKAVKTSILAGETADAKAWTWWRYWDKKRPGRKALGIRYRMHFEQVGRNQNTQGFLGRPH